MLLHRGRVAEFAAVEGIDLPVFHHLGHCHVHKVRSTNQLLTNFRCLFSSDGGGSFPMKLLVFLLSRWNNKLVVLILCSFVVGTLLACVRSIGRNTGAVIGSFSSLIHLINRLVCRIINNYYILGDILDSAMVNHLLVLLLLLLVLTRTWRAVGHMLLILPLIVLIVPVIIVVGVVGWWLVPLNDTVIICPSWRTHVVVLGQHAQVGD